MSPKAIIIGLSTNGYAVVRALGHRGVPLIILEEKANQEQSELKTKYGKKIFLDNLTGNDLIKTLSSLAINSKIVLFPVVEAVVSYLSEHRQKLSSRIQILFPSHKTVQLLLDKAMFNEFAESNDLPIPKTIVVNNYEEVQKSDNQLRFPVIMKTKKKIFIDGLDKAYVLNSKEELLSLYEKISYLNKTYVLQEFILAYLWQILLSQC